MTNEDKVATSQKKQDAAFVKIQNNKKIMIIGDMHGCEEALLTIPKAEEILKNGGAVVFLGDMIEHHPGLPGKDLSVNCLIEAIKLKVAYKDQVVVLRGNHESYKYGLEGNSPLCSDEKNRDYLNNVLTHLPIACVIEHNSKKYFCVHGGICKEILDHSEKDNFGLTKFNELSWNNTKIINYQVLWNDFRDTGYRYRENCSEYVNKFLTKNNYEAIFRGHDPLE